jgi:hypothetical protein
LLVLTKVTVPPFESLNDTQQLVVTALRGKSKTPKMLADELQRNYHVVQRALNDLKAKGWVEIDRVLSGGRSNSWKLKHIPSGAIEVIVDNGIDRKSISFNRYLETVAKQLAGGRKPKLAQEHEDYFKAIGLLGYYAAVEFTKPDSVTEAQLLEPRSVIQRFLKTLEDTYSIGKQILEDERYWHGDRLADGVMRKTDRYLTPAEVARYAQTINGAFNATSDEVSETNEFDSDSDSEEELGNADD